MAERQPRAFVLQRDEDETGVSGTGVVAWGVEFPDGVVSLRWCSAHRSTAVYDNIGELEAIHGHNGKTRVVWVHGGSGHSVNGRELTWPEAEAYERERGDRYSALAALLHDLDRCEHGRHEGDVCNGCNGLSRGNPRMRDDRVLGFNMAGRQIRFPARESRLPLNEYTSWIGGVRDLDEVTAVLAPDPPTEPLDRESLVSLCEDAITPYEKWHDRDSAHAHEQLGKAWALLKAGAPFDVRVRGASCVTDEKTIWIDVQWPGFNAFEWGRNEERNWESETFYIPTRARLDKAEGHDWY